MATPSSGAISLNEMHVEAGGSSGSECSINDADIRLIADKSSGATASWNDYYNRAADFSFTMTVGDTTTSVSDGYVTTVTRYRGFDTTTTHQGSAMPSGNSGLGSINDNQDADYLANAVIDVLYARGENGTSTNAVHIQIGDNGTITNNDTAFKSVVINGFTYNRSDCTFDQNNSADRPYSRWIINSGVGNAGAAGTPSDSSSNMGPFGGSGASNTITFRRSR